MKKINIGLFGADGKMGLAVQDMLAVVKTNNQLIPFLYIGVGSSDKFSFSAENINAVEKDLLNDVDVWIEFSSPEGLEELIKNTRSFKTTIVSGTTGLSKKQFSMLNSESKKRKIFWSSNMSPGLWAFRQAMKGLSSINQFDFAIEEVHHTKKKDKPSGTAKTLKEDLEKALNKKIQDVVSLRLGGVFGVHTLTAASSNEVIVMQHQALNRNVFAEGAIKAADWVANQKLGLYSMDDMYSKKRGRS